MALVLDGSSGIVFPDQSTNPANPAVGQLYYNSNDKTIKVYDGAEWISTSPVLGSFNNPARNGLQLYNQGFPSGYYYIQPPNENKRYCYVDNTHFGGGWVLVQVVGSTTNYHWTQTGDYNLYTSGVASNYVPYFGDGYSSTVGRKYSDTFIKAIGAEGEGVFRLEIARNGAQPVNNNTLTASTDYKCAQFVRYDNGISWYNTSNNGGDSDRVSKAIDIAHYYPYSSNWETGGAGHYILFSSGYRVFDGHSDPSGIASSLYSTVRFLWGYTPAGGEGIYGGGNSSYTFNANNDGNPGYMWIK